MEKAIREIPTMLIKLLIAGIIVLAGLVVFSTEINTHFPNTVSTGLESFKLDVASMTDQTLSVAGQKITNSSQRISAQLSSTADDTLDAAGHALEYAEDGAGTAGSAIGDGIGRLGEASGEFVEENITDRVGSLAAGDLPESGPGA